MDMMEKISPLSARLRKQADRVLAGTLCILALCIYLKTLCPTLYWGDCGELASAAHALGITHPTGYPVWTMLAKGWSLIFPFGTFIWRLNVLSAIIGTLAVGCMFAAARAMGASRPVSLMGAGVFAFSSTFWQQCLFAETYSLTACYCALLLLLAFRWRARGCRPADLHFLALAYGFAMTNGQLNTLFLPGFVLFVLWCAPGLRRWREPVTRAAWLRLLGLGCLPLLSYAYLPLRAMSRPVVDWGDPRTPYAFWYHVTGRDYAHLMFHGPLSQTWEFFSVWARNLNGEFAWPLVALAMYGLIVTARRAPQIAALLGWVIVADVGFTVNYFIYNHYIYFLPCYVAMALLMAAGANDLAQRIVPLITPQRRSLFEAVGTACLLLTVPFQAVAHWGRSDLHQNWTCYDYGRNLLASVPPQGILADNSEDTSWSAITYLQTVEHFRTDVTPLQCQVLASLYDPHYHHWANRWYWTQLTRRDPFLATLYAPGELTSHEVLSDGILRRLIPRALAAGRPLVVSGLGHKPDIADGTGHRILTQDYIQKRCDLVPIGLVARVYPRGKAPAPAVLLAQTQRVWGRYQLRGLSGSLYLQDNFLAPLLLQYANAALMRGRLAYVQGDYGDAQTAYRFVLQLFPSGEAAVGLDRCADALARRKRVASLP